MKLYTLPSLYRQGNFVRVGLYENDIATLLHYYPQNMDNLLKELAKYVNQSDLTEINSMVSDIQKRLCRFKKESRSSRSGE